MITEIVAGLLVVCVVCYTVHWHRERAKWARVRKKQLEKLNQLKRLRWRNKRFATAVPATT